MKFKRNIKYLFRTHLLALVALFSACSDWIDDYEMNDHEPDYLKASIYDYLKNDGNYTYFTRIIDMTEEDGIKYSEILGKTGSKTLFVANDEAFRDFFQNNEYGIRSFEDFSVAQCRAILFGGMLNNTYLLAMLTYSPGSPPAMGQIMRRETTLPLLDTVFLKKGNEIPDNPYWQNYREKGLYLLDDRTNYTLVHFLPVHMRMQGITDEDFYTMTNVRRASTDAYLFDIKIVEPDIICKNGYIHRLEKLLFPRETMAEYIRTNPETSKFNSFLERYSYPVYDEESTNAYKRTHPGFQDSIFVKWFFNTQESPTNEWTNTALMPRDVNAFLKYNPGKKSYSIAGYSVGGDMAAMFAPTDAALENYFNSDRGKTLKERYGTWENVPNEVLDILINHHMLQSFIQATPGRFADLADNMGTSMGAAADDVRYARICSNGIVYVNDVVYAPTKYVAVTGPVLMGAKTTLFNWIVNQLQYDLYLLSMEPGNRFSFFVPTDDAFNNYVDPASVAKGKPETLHFYIDPVDNSMKASRWDANGDSLGVYTSSFARNPSEKTKNYLDYLLMDIMDNHIVLQDIEPGKKYYRTKTGGTALITGQGDNLKVAGGANIDRNEEISVTTAYNMQNGSTYLINKVMQMPLRSAYSELGNKEDFSEFFDLCFDVKEILDGSSKAGGVIFGRNGTGIDENVRFFNTFHYTVYAPSNKAIRQAIADGLIMRWEDIEKLKDADYTRYLREATNLYDFLSYHFQDNSVYISDKFDEPVEYETANLERGSDGALTGKFRKLKITADGTDLWVQGAGNQTPVKVNRNDPAYYNLMVRDYQFTASSYNLSTSSFAVIHQIDEVLEYKTRR
ncbi:MAG: fasciclin domain-containing protein [Candidatus Symbiothrix sp.]|jgi:uncharacterized surface protein with fasciclin (FAS1) repeats|nr:fasciclin domain-containing protein [Candidatus Symbiothrix sp.]